jgi:hypothetical protein
VVAEGAGAGVAEAAHPALAAQVAAAAHPALAAQVAAAAPAAEVAASLTGDVAARQVAEVAAVTKRWIMSAPTWLMASYKPSRVVARPSSTRRPDFNPIEQLFAFLREQ